MAPAYVTLPERSIRLLQFLDDSGLKCRLTTYSLAVAPFYTALSYTWEKHFGQGQRPSIPRRCFIRINGKKVAVQENLYDFLTCHGKSVRRSPGCMLWVDSLCINQADKVELGRQVSIMKNIFQSAWNVVAWLGLPFSEKEVARAVSMMECFADDYQSCDSLYLTLRRHPLHYQSVQDDRLSKELSAISDDGVPGLQDILSRDYWSRTWIAQETSLPSDVLYLCGSAAFSRGQFLVTMEYIRCLATFFEYSHLYSCYRQRTLFNQSFQELVIGKNRTGLESPSLLTVIRTLRTTACSNPRDKVFAALNLASDCDHLLRVDYSRLLMDVYIDVVRYSLQDPALGLIFLGDVHGDRGDVVASHDHIRLPTWVPDWRDTRSRHALWVEQGDGSPLYDPCPGSKPCAAIRGPILEVSGHLLGKTRINRLTLAWQPTFDDRRIRFAQDWINNVKSWNVPSVTDDEILRCFVADASHGLDCRARLNMRTGQFGHQRGSMLDTRICSFDRSDDDIDLDQARLPCSSVTRAVYACGGRRMCLTTDDRLGLFPAEAKEGDIVAVLHGAHILYLIRPVMNSNQFRFIGECYVDGLMDGEAVSGKFMPVPPRQIFEFI